MIVEGQRVRVTYPFGPDATCCGEPATAACFRGVSLTTTDCAHIYLRTDCGVVAEVPYAAVVPEA